MAKAPNREKKTGDLLRRRKRKAEVKRAVLRQVRRLQNLGIHSANREWSLAQWFSGFINAQGDVVLKEFGDDARFFASLKGSSGRREEITTEKLLWVQKEVRGIIDWSLKTNPGPVSLSPSLRFSPLLERDGKKVNLRLFGENFTSRLLSHLFDVISAPKSYFAQCRVCQKVFARRGRQVYCSMRCLEKTRPAQARRDYFRQYMKKRRSRIKELRDRFPAFAEKVEAGQMSIREALWEMRKKRIV